MVNFLIKIWKIVFQENYIKLNLLSWGNYQIGFDLIFLNVINIILKTARIVSNYNWCMQYIYLWILMCYYTWLIIMDIQRPMWCVFLWLNGCNIN
jgi:hypothetical protein